MKRLLCVFSLILAFVFIFVSCTDTPTIAISEDGYWIINGEKTNVIARGEKGEQGDKGDCAVSENPQGLDFYLKDDGSYAVAAGTSIYLSKIVIPSTYNGKPVTEILAHGFEAQIHATDGDYRISLLEEITIPDTIKTIGANAFRNCNNIKKLYISDIQSWCMINFADCYSNPIYYNPDIYIEDAVITEITIPKNVTIINNYAFCGARKISKINYNAVSASVVNNITDFNHVFSYVGTETLGVKLVIGENVTKIPDSLFRGWEFNLKQIDITSNTLKEIGSESFSFCNYLESISFNGTIDEWNSISKDPAWNSYSSEFKIYCLDGVIE